MIRPTSEIVVSSLLNPAFIAEVKKVRLRSRRNVTSQLVSQYRSAFRGIGVVFSDLREYQPGDDVKHIHWRATARTNKVYVKSYDEDRQLSVVVLIDVSASTNYGAPRTRYVRSLEFAALLNALTEASGDLIALGLFADSLIEYLPPASSRSHHQHFISRLVAQRSLPQKTDLSETLRALRRKLKRRSVVFLASDFFSPPFDEELRLLSIKHDVICVAMVGNIERELPEVGLVRFADAETGEDVLVDTGHFGARAALTEFVERRMADLAARARAVGADFIRVSENPVRPLIELMKSRSSKTSPRPVERL